MVATALTDWVKGESVYIYTFAKQQGGKEWYLLIQM
jgi:hypothetical protein